MLFDAVVENDVLQLKKEIELGADIHAIDDEDWSALMHASYRGHIEIVKLLFESGADVNNLFKLDSFEFRIVTHFYQNYMIKI